MVVTRVSLYSCLHYISHDLTRGLGITSTEGVTSAYNTVLGSKCYPVLEWPLPTLHETRESECEKVESETTIESDPKVHGPDTNR